MSELNTSSTVDTIEGTVFRLLLDGQWIDGEDKTVEVLDKYLLKPFATVTTASRAQVERMVDSAHAAYRGEAPGPYQRGQILEKTARLVAGREADFVALMQAEAGFTAADAKGEVTRCMETLRLSAEEARRLAGEIVPLEGAPGQSGRFAFTLRVPLGVVAAITPFNSPLNTVTHKVAPAFAAGNAVILKPSTNTPGTACLLAELLLEAGMPRGFLSVLHGGGDVVRPLQDDLRVRFFAFTGSTEVGRSIQMGAGLRRTQMELGSIAFTVLCEDADLSLALPKVASAGYRKAGQVCTSVQILLVHRSLMADVEEKLSLLVAELPFGDPKDARTVVGPLISEKEAVRIEGWVEEAMSKGARRLVGGPRRGAVLPPTLLADVDPSMKVGCAEIFGPVVNLVAFDDIDEAIERINSTPYGLASGVFTNQLSLAFKVAKALEVGGVHINETSSSRVDLMPYGGSKDSGFGREGPRYAVQEMTEERLISITA